MFKRPLQVWTHHRIVHDDDSLGGASADVGADGRQVRDLEQRIGRALQENHGRLPWFQDGVKLLRLSRVYMMDCDTLVNLKVTEEPVRSPVQIVPGDDLVSSFEQTRHDVQSRHPRGYSEGMTSGRYLC